MKKGRKSKITFYGEVRCCFVYVTDVFLNSP